MKQYNVTQGFVKCYSASNHSCEDATFIIPVDSMGQWQSFGDMGSTH